MAVQHTSVGFLYDIHPDLRLLSVALNSVPGVKTFASKRIRHAEESGESYSLDWNVRFYVDDEEGCGWAALQIVVMAIRRLMDRYEEETVRGECMDSVLELSMDMFPADNTPRPLHCMVAGEKLDPEALAMLIEEVRSKTHSATLEA